MSKRNWRQAVPAAALACAMIVGGCGERREGAGETGAASSMSSADTAGTMSDSGSMSTGAGSAMTDPNIMALLDEANKADSSSGAMAATKGTSPDVKAYGKLMMK